MLLGLAPTIVGSAKPATIAATDSRGWSNSNTTYSGTLAVGAAHPNRLVVIGFSAWGPSGDFVSAKINGVHSQVGSATSGSPRFAAAMVPTGTTIAWEFKTASAGTRHAVCVWTVDRGVPNPEIVNLRALSGIAPAPGGAAVIGVGRVAASGTFVWTGLNEDYDFMPASSSSISGASIVAAGPEQDWSCTSSAGGGGCEVLVIF